MNKLNPLYTIGHSNLETGAFLSLLRAAAVEVLADVRSLPRSRRNPHFDREQLERSLRDVGIRYVFLGEELGGRPEDPRAYRDGRVDYKLRRKSHAFQQGIEQILWWLERHSVAMMCAEEDPLECHRFLMNCAELSSLGLRPLHIRTDGKVEKQEDVEERLLVAVGFGDIGKDSLFRETPDRDRALEEAYAIQAASYAFRLEPSPTTAWELDE